MQFNKSQLYGSVANASDPMDALVSLVQASGFTALNKSDGACTFAAVTVNNLPILMQATYDNFQE